MINMNYGHRSLRSSFHRQNRHWKINRKSIFYDKKAITHIAKLVETISIET